LRSLAREAALLSAPGLGSVGTGAGLGHALDSHKRAIGLTKRSTGQQPSKVLCNHAYSLMLAPFHSHVARMLEDRLTA